MVLTAARAGAATKGGRPEEGGRDDRFVIDGSAFLTPIPHGSAALGASSLAAYAQDAGWGLLARAVRAKVADMQGQSTINQYFRGSVDVLLPPGVIPLTATASLISSRTRLIGHDRGTVFAKCADFGDMLVVGDERSPNATGDIVVSGLSAIDLSASSGGALFRFLNVGPGLLDRLTTQNGFIGIAMDGCTDTILRDAHCKYDAAFSGGNARPGSACLSFVSGTKDATNSAIQVAGGIFAGDTVAARLVQDAIAISACDVILFTGTYCGCVSRAAMAFLATGSNSVQGVETAAMRFDNGARFGFLATGTTTGNFGDCKINGKFFSHDQNNVRIDTGSFSGGQFDIETVGSGREAVVLQGVDNTVTGLMRGIGTAATADHQVSAIWMKGNGLAARSCEIRAYSKYALAYGIEVATGFFGCSAEVSTVEPGAGALGGTSYADGSFAVNGVSCIGGPPDTARSRISPRTNPGTIN